MVQISVTVHPKRGFAGSRAVIPAGSQQMVKQMGLFWLPGPGARSHLQAPNRCLVEKEFPRN